MRHPHVQFIVDQKFDTEIASAFLNEKIGSYDFGHDRILRKHPALAAWRHLPETKRQPLIRTYIKQYSAEHARDIARAIDQMQHIWDRVEPKFFLALEQIFGSLSFYRPTLIRAKLSLFTCGVVDENMRAFQIWYGTAREPAEVRRHVAHELLHFYYYTYLKKHGYHKLINDWDAAEIFNRIILNEPSFFRLTKREELGYAHHTRRVPRYRKIWERSESLDQYLSTLNLERG